MSTEITVLPKQIGALIDMGEQALADASNDFERIQLRDQAKAYEAAAAIVKRRDIQVIASVLVAKAERAIHNANPPKTPRQGGQKGGRGRPIGVVSETTPIDKNEMTAIRRAHSGVTSDQFKEITENAVETGQPITRAALQVVSRANKKAARKAEKQAKHQAAIKLAKDAPPGAVHVCSCREFTAHVEAESLDAIFTDPPYPQEYLPCWDELGEFAMHALKPGGVLLAMSGQQNLPEILDRLRESGLKYRWLVAYVYARQHGEPWGPAKVGVAWKPLVAFTKPGKGPARFSEDCFTAVPKSPNDKDEHEWGQNPEGVRAVADQWLEPGWKVADPFCGAGALMVAAYEMGCEIVGCDIDAGHAQKTRDNLEKAKKPC